MDKLKRVVVGMSGGIDSSVAALLLKEQGYDVIGVTLKHLPDELSEISGKTCCSLDDISDAKMTCYTLGIPHYTINVTEEFQKEVMNYFVETYHAGKTPSPCVICDEKVKINKIVEFSDKMGIKYIATGHYSKKSMSDLLLWDKNNPKDQSYMLYRLDRSVIERFLFPLSGYEKSEVRKIARENGIHIHAKPDSQGICFAPDGYIPFLKNVLGNSVEKGKFINKKGETIGEHEGYQLYTIGQRRGLGLNLGRPFFVLEIRPDTNEVVIGDFDELLINRIEIINHKFHYKIEKLLNKVLIARPRFSSKGLKGELISEIKNGKEKLYFKFDKKNAENSEGQHIVFYLENELVGGGEIKKVL
ncbi:tRNA 2-thiouridine(34) synthase MnmA [Leptotrichia sp. OH3620_COT-345]|uniref:tRNA 2-thiouridine(34) synthase MnmA n=1 Tax=Leptotrichia sp. OH3620_COT-345 TaxID=2491048 RepID=UPI000F64E8C5|nr:tRNA 2-thiouridine(34) synthase MnmA [Leptotrichia sp. OH3620_COT-345]RRD39599.1 tRNA 2-thiouridine(34) synthase MnmA [Leptotrichia sp. OH3620_COT-345]